MNFQEAIMTCLKEKYAKFDGRARRSEYWYFWLLYVVVVIGLGFVSQTLSSLASLALMVPALAVCCRRLHDIGKSGWLQLVALVPLVGAIYLIYLLVQDSQAGENEYGSNPKA